jgi:hypothetical protein
MSKSEDHIEEAFVIALEGHVCQLARSIAVTSPRIDHRGSVDHGLQQLLTCDRLCCPL